MVPILRKATPHYGMDFLTVMDLLRYPQVNDNPGDYLPLKVDDPLDGEVQAKAGQERVSQLNS